jgi:fructosamine-3-kinase
MHYEGDISWPVLRRIVHDWAGNSVELSEMSPLDGGSISTTVRLDLSNGQRAVLKLSQHRVDRNYEREAFQLDLLRSIGLPVPRVFAFKIGTLEDPNSYLLMEFVEGVDLAHAKQQCAAEDFDGLQQQLAEMVVNLHGHTSDKFGRVLPNGSASRHESWPAFYREVYDGIWKEAEKIPSLPKAARKTIAKVHDRLERFIAHDDKPRLVHWDIWSTNILADRDASGKWRITALLDPNCKYAHAEAEIAYIDLFQTSTPAFMKVYQQSYKLDKTYHQVRKPVYQLYPLLNDLAMFGHDYLKPLLLAVDHVAPLV